MDFPASGSSDSGACFALFSVMLCTHFAVDALPAERADSFRSCATSTLSHAITIKVGAFQIPREFHNPRSN